MTSVSREFWAKWHSADELGKVDLIKTLTLPAKIGDEEAYKYHSAVLINSYLLDLMDYLAVIGGNREQCTL